MFRTFNTKLIARVLVLNLFIVSSSFLLCAGLARAFSEDYMPFIWSFIISALPGAGLFIYSRGLGDDPDLQRREAYITVTFSWVILGLVGSLPYLISGAIPSFTDALFESVSGFTTTGSSILSDIESLPMSILFWRSLTHWIGGIGIIMLVIIIFPSLKIGGYHLFTRESSLQEKIKPKIKQIGLRLLGIYVGLTIAEVLLLLAGKMSLFESVCHAFGTIATGGFSPRNNSIADYSPYIQYVIMIFMVLAGTNFVIHYYMLNGDIQKVRMNDEFRFYLGAIFLLGSIVTVSLITFMGKPLEAAFREAFFQVISIVTCTGFATADYLRWPAFAWLLILFAMFLGGSTGSTAGGIKMVRHLILIRNLRNSIRHALHPKAILPLRVNNQTLTPEINNAALTFIVNYVFIFVVGTFLLIFMGIDSATSSSAVATCMAGIGPGIGSVGPSGNFHHLPEAGKILLAFLMIVGRLEIYTVMILFSKSFWRL